MNNCLVLNYHQIFDSLSHQESKYCLPISNFKHHLEALSKSGRKCWSSQDINTSSESGFLLTFDDGYSSDIEIVLPLLREYNYKAIFFLPLNSNGFLYHKDSYTKALKNGHSIGAHGINHRSFRKFTLKEQIDEMKKCKTELENSFQNVVKDFSLPYGQSNRHTDLAAKISGYNRVYSTKFGFYNSTIRTKYIPRVNINSIVSRDNFNRLIGKPSLTHRALKIQSDLKHLISNSIEPEVLYHFQKSIQK